MSAKHTNGPWSYQDNPYGHDAIRGADGRLIAHVFGDDAQAQEDARLISAAPELLEALKRLLNPDADEHLTEQGVRNLARAAISKATGEQA